MMRMQEGYDTVEMLVHLEEEEMLGWGFKKPHARCIIQNLQGINSGPQQRSSSGMSAGSSEAGWDKARYTTVQKLGEGGFGCSWLVIDTLQANKEFALKEVRCDNLDVANQAIEESSFMMHLQHPQLVRRCAS